MALAESTLRLSYTAVEVGIGPLSRRAIGYADRLEFSHNENTFSLEFAALSYVDPETNHYRYKLDGLDEKWHEADSGHRQASYTTLPAGKYTFRVEAAIRAGAWSEPGVALPISILPAWPQTWWFRTAGALVTAGVLWQAYRFRVAQIAHQLDLRFQERLRERTRIAQELHDTLLQNVAGLCLQIGGLSKIVATATESARERLKELRMQGEQCLREARQAVWNIRSLGSENRDLATELRECGERMTGGTQTRFVITVEGDPYPIAEDLREQILRIGQESIANAARHARARQIEVCLSFDADSIRMRISDDGEGFDVHGATAPGHFGLTTMRERAQGIDASISISSERLHGSCVEVSVPLGGRS